MGRSSKEPGTASVEAARALRDAGVKLETCRYWWMILHYADREEPVIELADSLDYGWHPVPGAMNLREWEQIAAPTLEEALELVPKVYSVLLPATKVGAKVVLLVESYSFIADPEKEADLLRGTSKPRREQLAFRSEAFVVGSGETRVDAVVRAIAHLGTG